MSKIAMFGGSFNPVHKAHVGLLLRMKDIFSLDIIYVIPTYNTPLKDNTPILSCTHRLNMCKLAFEDVDGVIVSDTEIRRGGESYTADTLAEISRLHPHDELYLITGADSFMQLDRWYCPEKVFSLAHILTVSRGEYDFDDLSSQKQKYELVFGARISIVEEPIALMSSTDVRNAIRDKKDFTHLLPVGVSDYIKTNRLYSYECK